MTKLYTIKEVSEILRCTIKTLYRWEKKGKINLLRINGKVRVTQEELNRLLLGD